MNLNKDTVLGFCPYRIYHNDNEVYIYTSNTSGLFQVNQQVLDIIDHKGELLAEAYQEIKDKMTFEEYINLLLSMQAACFLVDEHDLNESTKSDNKGISALTLMVAQECNMRCKYCYGDGGEYCNSGRMSARTAKKAIDFLVSNSCESTLFIAFLGGEPLLNFELIQYIVEYCKSISRERKINFLYTLTTNGTIMTEEIENFIFDNKIHTQISIDGNEEKHNVNRCFSGGKESYQCVINKTKNLRGKKYVTARATVTSVNMDYIEIFEHLYKLDFRAIPIAAAQNMINKNDREAHMNEYKRYISHYGELIKAKRYDKVKKMYILNNYMKKIIYGNKRETSCNAGRTTYAVDIDGILYPCHRFVGNSDFILGDINKEDNEKKEDFIGKLDVKNRQKCKNCWAQNLCLGGCPSENYYNTGHIEQSSEDQCDFIKDVFNDLITIYLQLSQEDIEAICGETTDEQQENSILNAGI